ncbi:MAG: helix-turn-helix transcriptional regulator [Gammaproteobacteria bacterium]
MIKGIGSRQDQILQLLLTTRSGMDIEEIAEQLSISRNAVKQHLVVLEHEQLIKKDALKSTRGRPSQNYILTEQGINHFPKQYAWFSNLLLDDLKAEMKEDSFKKFMRKLGIKQATTMLSKFSNKTPEERINLLVELMQTLGYQAIRDADSGEPVIKASNCVYHDLAQQYPEICEFDRALMSTLLNKTIEQTSCMAQQDCVCRFHIK